MPPGQSTKEKKNLQWHIRFLLKLNDQNRKQFQKHETAIMKLKATITKIKAQEKAVKMRATIRELTIQQQAATIKMLKAELKAKNAMKAMRSMKAK